MRIVGVDPGINGGLCFMTDGVVNAVVKTPTYAYTVGSGKKLKKKKMLDAEIVGELIKKFNPHAVYIEKVGGMPGQGITSTFNFGFVTGMVHGICGALKIKVTTVRPQEWKKVILENEDHDKDAAIGFCQQNFPDVNLLPTKRSTEPHDGMAESICIAIFGLKNEINKINTTGDSTNEG